MNINFITTTGYKSIVEVSHGTTIEQLLKRYILSRGENIMKWNKIIKVKYIKDSRVNKINIVKNLHLI